MPLRPIDQSSYRYNLEYRAGVQAEMLKLVKQLLSGDLGIVAGARALGPFRDAVEPEVAKILDVFVAIDSDTDSFPLESSQTVESRIAGARGYKARSRRAYLA